MCYLNAIVKASFICVNGIVDVKVYVDMNMYVKLRVIMNTTARVSVNVNVCECGRGCGYEPKHGCESM